MKRNAVTQKADILVLSAHADDAEFGAAGTVAKWVRAGTEARYVVVTSGDADRDVYNLEIENFAAPVPSAPELPSTAVLAGHLLNELDALPGPWAIALDDYHRIDRASLVHELLGRLLEHPPRRVSLVLITRRDPPLPCASLRANGRLVEMRLHDLRFTAPETAE